MSMASMSVNFVYLRRYLPNEKYGSVDNKRTAGFSQRSKYIRVEIHSTGKFSRVGAPFHILLVTQPAAVRVG